jgi:hypothetical protein
VALSASASFAQYCLWRVSFGCAEDGEGLAFGITYLFRPAAYRSIYRMLRVALRSVKRVRFMPTDPALGVRLMGVLRWAGRVDGEAAG